MFVNCQSPPCLFHCSPSSPMLPQFPICFSNPPNLAPMLPSPCPPFLHCVDTTA